MRELLPYMVLYRHHIGQIALGMMLSIVTLLANIGLLSLSGWFLASSVLAGASGIYSFNYMLPAAGVRIAAITRTTGRWAERVINHDVTFRVLQHLRLYLFIKIFPLSPSVLGHFRQAELLNCIVADVDTLDHLYLRVVSPIIGALTVMMVVAVGLSLLDLRLALTLGAIMLTVLLLFPILFYRAGRSIGQAITELRADYRIHLNTCLNSNAELIIYGAADCYRRQLDNIERQWQQQQHQHSSLVASAQSLLILITGMTLILVLWLAASSIDKVTQYSELIALFMFITISAFEALGPVADAFQAMAQVITSAIRINNIITYPPAVTFTTNKTSIEKNVALNISQLHFKYPQQKELAIRNLSMNVAAGEHIAILGHTGSGKSSLLKLLTRTWDPNSGEINFNGIPLSLWGEKTLRAMTTVVPQHIHIFSATLRENLYLAAPQVSDHQLNKILLQVGLDKLLTGDGLNAWIGEGGRQLSGGEQRLIGIARALLHNAPLWLLDEPTEGLDAINEQHILLLLQTFAQDRTFIIVTHRLMGLENLDCIYIMDNGSIIEYGNHYDLMVKRGHYYQYHRSLSLKLM